MAYLTLADLGRRLDPTGKIADMAEMLSQCNEVMDDMPWREANGLTSHVTTVRTGLPRPTYIRYYQGAQYTKSNAAQMEFGMSLLRDYSQIDKKLAQLGGNASETRQEEDMAHMEGMSLTQSITAVYGNSATVPESFTGLMPYYNTVSTANAQNAQNVFDCGGTGSSNASILLVGWGERTCYGIYPKGSQGGLVFEDKGDVVPGFDSLGQRFEAYTSMFEWSAGLVVADWRYLIRLANIDTTTAGLLGSTPPDLFAIMARAMVRLPTASTRQSGIVKMGSKEAGRMNVAPAVKLNFYTNRTVRAAMDVQAIRDKNVLLSPTEYDGQPIVTFRGIPIKVQDTMLSTEARVV